VTKGSGPFLISLYGAPRGRGGKTLIPPVEARDKRGMGQSGTIFASWKEGDVPKTERALNPLARKARRGDIRVVESALNVDTGDYSNHQTRKTLHRGARREGVFGGGAQYTHLWWKVIVEQQSRQFWRRKVKTSNLPCTTPRKEKQASWNMGPPSFFST